MSSAEGSEPGQSWPGFSSPGQREIALLNFARELAAEEPRPSRLVLSIAEIGMIPPVLSRNEQAFMLCGTG